MIKLNTRTILADSIYELLQKTSFDKITVQMIIENSGLSRTTFYRYFRDKYDVMNWYYQRNIDRLLDEVDGTNYDIILVRMLKFFYDNNAYCLKILHTEGINSFPDFLYGYTFNFYEREYLRRKGSKSLNSEERIYIEFYSNAGIFIVKQWFDRGLQEPYEKIAEIIYKIMPEIMRPYF